MLKKPNLFISNYGLEDILVWPKEDTVDESTGFIDMIEFIDYLKNKKKRIMKLRKKKFTFGNIKLVSHVTRRQAHQKKDISTECP